jgi:hypothetical protein
MRSRRAALTILVSVLACAAGVPAAAGERALAERILAVVNNRPVLLSETRLLMLLRGIDKRAAVDLLVDEILMGTEASKLPQAAVAPGEETSAVESLRTRIAPSASEDVDPGRLRALARRQAMILKYVEFRFRPQLRVDEELLHRRTKDAEASGQIAEEGFEDRLRTQLLNEEMDRRVEAWVRELRAGAEIRYNAP